MREGIPIGDEGHASVATTRASIRRVGGAGRIVLGAVALLAIGAASARAAGDTLSTTARAYVAFSASVLPADASVRTLLDELGDYDATRWRLFSWNPGRAAYDEAGADFESLERGRGYWLITRDPATVTYQGEAVAADTFDIPLARGPGLSQWYQLGNPHPFAVDVADWVVVKRDSQTTIDSSANVFTERARPALVRNPVTQQYDVATRVQRNEAFWMHAIDPDTAARWTMWDLGPPTAGTSGVLMAVDTSGTVHVIVSRGDTLSYGRRKGYGWTWETVGDFPGAQVALVAFAVEPGGQPHLVYRSYSSSTGKYYFLYSTRIAGSWSIGSLDYVLTQSGATAMDQMSQAQMSIDQAGGPHVVAWDPGGFKVVHWYKSSGRWAQETIGSLVDFEGYPTPRLQIDPQGRIHVVYRLHNDGTGDSWVQYAVKEGGWVNEQLPMPEAAGRGCSIVIDGAGTPHVLFLDERHAVATLYHAFKVQGSWVIEPVGEAGGTFSAISVGADGIVLALYVSPQGLRVSRRVAGVWSIVRTDTLNLKDGYIRDFATGPDGAFRGTWTASAPNRWAWFELLPSTLHLRVPARAASGPAAQPASDPTRADWSIQLIATQDGRTSAPLVLAAAPDVAAGGWNPRCLSVVPDPPGETALRLSVAHRDWGPMNGRYLCDVQRSTPEMSWAADLEGAQAPGEVALTVAASGLPDDARVWITDETSAWTAPLRPGESVTLPARQQPTPLRVYVATAGGAPPTGGPTREGAQRAYPNPFASSVGLAFTLSAAADVRLEIFDLAGRRCHDAGLGRLGSGEHVLVWDGRDDSGRAIAPGLYLARLSTPRFTHTYRLLRVE